MSATDRRNLIQACNKIRSETQDPQVFVGINKILISLI